MRIALVARFLSLGLLTFTPLLMHGQFQEPTKEELQMTSDPKAPGAAAVYLNYEESAVDALQYHEVYARIKVLNEKGKDLATVEVQSYGDYKVAAVKARTIHADGKVIPLDVKPEQLVMAKVGDAKLRKTVFTLPSVEVGSILEYRYQIRYDKGLWSPDWNIQKEYWVRKAHYSFNPYRGGVVDSQGNAANRLVWWPHLPPGAEVKRDWAGILSLDLADVPPVPHEAYMPPIRSLLYHVNFYYAGSSVKAFWQDEAKRWWSEVDHFAEPTKPIKAVAESLVAASDSDLEKAHKLYKAVQQLENTDFTRGKSKAELKQMGLKQAKRAEDTWAQKSGSRQDIALLYLALLRAVGLTAYDMKVVNRDEGIFAPDYLWWGQLDDDVIVLSTGGKEIVLDPGEKMCPFQVVHWKHTAAGGIRQGLHDQVDWNTPLQSYMSNTVTRMGDVTLDEQGAMKGSFRIVMSGQEALHWRQQTLFKDEAEVKKEFDHWLQDVFPAGVEAHLHHFLGMDDPEANLMAIVNAEGSLGAATSKRLMVPGFFFESRGERVFGEQEKRQIPVDMHYSGRVTDQVTYHLPAGMQVEGAPQDAKIPWADQAVLVVKVASKPGEVTVARQYSRGFTFVGAEKYEQLRDYYQKLAQNDEQQVVLTMSAAAAQKGN